MMLVGNYQVVVTEAKKAYGLDSKDLWLVSLEMREVSRILMFHATTTHISPKLLAIASVTEADLRRHKTASNVNVSFT